MSCFVLQVLRYHQSGEPLWVSDEGKPSEDDIPRCECGSERVFEFQVMMMVTFKAFKSHDNGTFSVCGVFSCSQYFEQKILFFLAKLNSEYSSTQEPTKICLSSKMWLYTAQLIPVRHTSHSYQNLTFSGFFFVQFLSLQLISKDHFCTLK